MANKNIKAGEALHSGDGGYGIGTQENYNEFVKIRNQSLTITNPQQQHTWVGLTIEDKEEYLALDFGGNRLDAMDWAEQRLKEKNNGSW